MSFDASHPDQRQRLVAPAGSIAPAGCAFMAAAACLLLLLEKANPTSLVTVMVVSFSALAVILWRVRSPLVAIEFGPDGFSLEGEPELVAYESIQAVTIKSRSPRLTDTIPIGHILVVHQRGQLTIPQTIPHVQELYIYLASKMQGSGSRDVAAPIQTYLDKQLSQFDNDLVWSFCASSSLQRAVPRVRLSAFFVWLLVVSVTVLITAGSVKWNVKLVRVMNAVAAVSLMVAIITLLIIAIRSSMRRRPLKNAAGSSLVIGPVGIALKQGTLFGELAWEEVSRIHYGMTARSFQLSSSSDATGGMRIDVPGASLFVADIYDRPLWMIYDVAMQYWRVPTE